ncbi:hypothetical protein HYDPIDRAFT_33062 [Hydnomerulius pinastri MD-312]|uniref:Unplaced genomic scaffold scaffold_119, whole genome shotgun sequence n=1 Tax=Hydnomerulius pinastri MD-312 TaxID=994086 RepID=A0A0C9W8Z1_9AGAM|nr:hypothetical protein HYDPIDRAFT_34291 [Hydnomerulius pinastri MD-312]KIJ59621.1 hypothetical protein HYDPIDRAFT_33062 [Hydnomerulius pinastri MD-312]
MSSIHSISSSASRRAPRRGTQGLNQRASRLSSPRATNPTSCTAWRDRVACDLPDPYPSPPGSHPLDVAGDLDLHMTPNHPLDVGGDSDLHMTPNHSLPPCLYTPHDNDLTVALIKAQRVERRAEKRLIQKRLKRVKIERELYNNMDHETDQRLHAADVNVGIARALRRIAGVEVRGRGGRADRDLDACSDTSASSTTSDLDSSF